MTASIVAMGIVTTLYATLGGVEAVIWTDVVQAIVLIGGALLALVVAVVAAAGWTALDLGVGLIMAAIMLPAWYAAEALAGALGPASTWVAFGVMFVGGWALQFLGHHYEGKRPALLDNVFQAFIGPMFLVAETLVASGYRADLAETMGEGDDGTTEPR